MYEVTKAFTLYGVDYKKGDKVNLSPSLYEANKDNLKDVKKSDK